MKIKPNLHVYKKKYVSRWAVNSWLTSRNTRTTLCTYSFQKDWSTSTTSTQFCRTQNRQHSFIQYTAVQRKQTTKIEVQSIHVDTFSCIIYSLCIFEFSSILAHFLFPDVLLTWMFCRTPVLSPTLTSVLLRLLLNDLPSALPVLHACHNFHFDWNINSLLLILQQICYYNQVLNTITQLRTTLSHELLSEQNHTRIALKTPTFEQLYIIRSTIPRARLQPKFSRGTALFTGWKSKCLEFLGLI